MNAHHEDHRSNAGRATLAGTVLALATAPLTALAADAPDPVKELTQSHSSVQLGVGYVPEDSYKFGEYNGLQRQGLHLLGDFDLRGGGSYDSNDATRWRVTGNNLGLDTRSVGAEYGKQGLFRVTFGVDTIVRNRSDSYSTPYLGVGTSVLTLPPSWIVPTVPRVSTTAANARGLSPAVANSSALVNGVLSSPTAAMLASSNALMTADLPLFAQHKLSTKRSRYEAGLTYELSSRWEVAASARREHRTGAKPMGTVVRSSGGDISTTLPDPIEQTTDQFNLSLAFRGKADFLTLAYYGSRFNNDVRSLTWTNWALPTSAVTMSSAPGNQFNQFTLTAGHDFTRTSRVVLTAGYGRTTQNQSYLTDASTPLVPASSLNGEVLTRSFHLKYTSRPSRVLSLAAAYKFDERENRTAVRTYGFYDANEPAGAANIDSAFAAALGVPVAQLKSNTNINASRPYSRRVNQFNGDADLRLGARNALKAGYEWQQIERWCNGSWIDCVDAARTRENTGLLEWRVNPASSLSAKLSWSYGRRTVDRYNENAFLALVPMAGVSPSTASGGASAYSFMLANGWNGFGPNAGYAATTGNMNVFFPLNNALANATYANQNRISELPGMRRYNMANRNRTRGRANLEWQATERLSLHSDLDYTRDAYADSVYGLLDSRDWAVNLEASYSASENLAVTVFYTHENQRSHSAGNTYTANSAATNVNGFTAISGGCYATIALRNASNKIDPCLNWSTDMTNRTHVAGVTFERRNLLRHKLTLAADLVTTHATTDYDVLGGNYANNPLAVAGAPAGTIAAYYIPTRRLPYVWTDDTQLRVRADYAKSPRERVRIAYWYAQLSAHDYAYDGMQAGPLSGVLPTLETAPRYVEHVVAVSYARQF
jgi:MtrB/PioB family decaheme-associated outer membrane protein